MRPEDAIATERAPAREIFGWAMYDFANSSYTTVIVTVVYAIVFPKLVVGDAPDFRMGNLLWSVALAISYALAVLTLPVLGALMDHTGHKKRYLVVSTAIVVASTAALFFAGPGYVVLAMVLVILSSYGFSIGESFIAAFLPDLGPPETLGKISGMAWGLGYIGGLGSTALVLFGLGEQTVDNWSSLRFIGPITAAWFAIAAIPTFLLLKDRGQPRPPREGTMLTAGFQQLVGTARSLRSFRDLMVFFASYLCAMAGLSIVISFAFIYGDQVIQWSPLTQQLMFILTQISASLGALGFGFLQSRIGDKPTYALTLVVWIAAVALIYLTVPIADGVRGLTGAELSTEHVFLGVGAAAGICIGATQSGSRTLVALYSPDSKTGEFFGLWGVFGKLAAIWGLLALGILQAYIGLETGILLTGVFFAAGLFVVLFVDDKRARQVAAEWDA